MFIFRTVLHRNSGIPAPLLCSEIDIDKKRELKESNKRIRMYPHSQ